MNQSKQEHPTLTWKSMEKLSNWESGKAGILYGLVVRINPNQCIASIAEKYVLNISRTKKKQQHINTLIRN